VTQASGSSGLNRANVESSSAWARVTASPTELARAGWDLLSLQRIGRHSDPKTTLGYIEEFGPSRGETQRAREELEEQQRREDRVVPLRRER
jgi:hypothetical protein